MSCWSWSSHGPLSSTQACPTQRRAQPGHALDMGCRHVIWNTNIFLITLICCEWSLPGGHRAAGRIAPVAALCTTHLPSHGRFSSMSPCSWILLKTLTSVTYWTGMQWNRAVASHTALPTAVETDADQTYVWEDVFTVRTHPTTTSYPTTYYCIAKHIILSVKKSYNWMHFHHVWLHLPLGHEKMGASWTRKKNTFPEP